VGLLDRSHIIGDVAKSAFPHPDDSHSLCRKPAEKLLLHFPVLGHLLHMRAIDNDIRHLEDTELLLHRAHYTGWHEHLERAGFYTLAHLLVVTELAGMRNLDVHFTVQASVDALRILIGRNGEQRARKAHMAESQRERLRLHRYLPEY